MKNKTEKTERLMRLMTEVSDDLQQKAFQTDSPEAFRKLTKKPGKSKKIVIALIAAVLAAVMVFGGFWGFRNRGQHGIPEVSLTESTQGEARTPVGEGTSSPNGIQTENPGGESTAALPVQSDPQGTGTAVPPVQTGVPADTATVPPVQTNVPKDTGTVPPVQTKTPVDTATVPPVQTKSPQVTTSEPAVPEAPMKMVSVGDLRSLPIWEVNSRTALSEFDLRLMDFMAQSTEGNYVVSPLSFRYALGLLLSGSAGETRMELMNALGVRSVEEWNDYCAKCNGIIQNFAADFAAELASYNSQKHEPGDVPPFRAFQAANSIWKRADLFGEFNESYKNTIGDYYGAEFSSFTGENAVQKINQWARDKTNGLIDPFLSDDYNTENLAIVLMNALYFQDTWEIPFNEETSVMGFRTQSGTLTEKKYMEVTESFSYYRDGQTQLVILPMAGDIRMAVVIGDASNLSEKISHARSMAVHVTVPLMNIETRLDTQLLEFLKVNGVRKAFNSGEADFSEMIALGTDRNIYVDEILQRTRMKTSTGGVEAAAATAVMMREKSGPEAAVEFTADQPFSFWIYTSADDVTALLFAGEMVE